MNPASRLSDGNYARIITLVAFSAGALFWGKTLAEVVTMPRQHDFALYSHAAERWKAGEDPYSDPDLLKAYGTSEYARFSYPPLTLPLFSAFTFLDRQTAYVSYLFLKTCALLALLDSGHGFSFGTRCHGLSSFCFLPSPSIPLHGLTSWQGTYRRLNNSFSGFP